MQTNCVFDATRPVAVQLLGPGGLKTVRVRFPADDEWAERQRRRKLIVKQLGRGISETTIPNGEEIDAALLAKIRTEEEPEVDAFEAQKVIEQLATCDVDDVVLAGDSFRVVLRVLGGTVSHVLKMASAKDVNQYRRGFARVLDLPFNRQELTINVRAAGDLYKKLIDGTKDISERFRSSIRRSPSKQPSTLSTPPFRRIGTQIFRRGVAGEALPPLPRALGTPAR